MSIKKIFILIFIFALGISSLCGCIQYNPIAPDNSAEQDLIKPSDEEGKPVNVILAKDETISDYFTESLTDTILRVNKSVVSVVASYPDGKGGTTKQTASGVVLGTTEGQPGSSYIAVPHHLIVGASTVSIYVDGVETAIKSSYVGTDPQTNLCVLNIKEELPSVIIPEIPSEGEEIVSCIGKSVFTVADALGKRVNVVSKGIICSDNYMLPLSEGKFEKYYLTDAYVSASSSGGGLFSENGGLFMGMINGTISEGGDWRGFVLPASMVFKVCSEIIQNTEHCVLGRYKLGFAVEDVRTAWGLTESVKVTSVDVDGSFYNNGNGLKVGDIILSFRIGEDEKKTMVNSSEEIYDWLYTKRVDELRVGQKVYFSIKRNGTDVDIALDIKQYKYSSDRY